MTRRVFFGLCAVATVLLTGAVFGGYLLRMFLVVLAFAFLLRTAYVVVRRGNGRPLWSGWIFVVALALAAMNLVGAYHRTRERSAAAAIREGLVTDRSELTPHIRCVALYLVAWERQPVDERVWPTKADDRAFASEVCRRAASERALYGDGYVEPRAAERLEAAVTAELAP
jgi:hypothetical protein